MRTQKKRRKDHEAAKRISPGDRYPQGRTRAGGRPSVGVRYGSGGRAARGKRRAGGDVYKRQAQRRPCPSLHTEGAGTKRIFPALWKAHQTTAARENAAPQVCARTKSRSNAHPSISRLFDSFLLLPIKNDLDGRGPGTGRTAEKIARGYFFIALPCKAIKSSHVGCPGPWS